MNRQTLYFTAPYHVVIRDEPMPPLAPQQLLVQTALSAISAGTEMLVYRGQLPTEMAIDDTIDALAGQFRYPLAYGYATVGRVVAVGSAVSNTWQGQLVFAFQPHQTHFVTEAEHLIPVPTGISPETALFLPNMETAVSFLMDGQPIIGERVLVLGQGVVGLLTTTLLAAYPLTELRTIDSYPLRQQHALQLGADCCLTPAAAAAQTDSPPIDLAYELSGNPQALNQAITMVGFNGRVVIGSWYGQKAAQLNLGGQFHRSHMRLISSQVSQLAPQWRGRWHKQRRLQVAWSMLDQHRPEHLITHRFPFAEAAQAYHRLDHHPDQTIQLLLTY